VYCLPFAAVCAMASSPLSDNTTPVTVDNAVIRITDRCKAGFVRIVPPGLTADCPETILRPRQLQYYAP